MRKVFKSNKAFAMSELLIAAVVILGIFALLFSNFMPLMSEYENREVYNNPTSKYAAFYLRKMYIKALESETNGVDRKAVLNENIKEKNYYQVYNKKNNKICSNILLEDKDLCENIIKEYNIEEVIITTYKVQSVKKSYPKDGVFYSYIKYLPNYRESSDGKELYRIILKTKDYGYATTKILSDYKTNTKCFVGKPNPNEKLEIIDYLYDGKECTDNVIITGDRVTIKDKSGNNISGVITKIGDKAFLNKPIKNFSYGNTIEEIKDKAFLNTRLESFKFNSTLKVIGDEAFSNTNIKEVVIPNHISIGNKAFSGNNYLTDIEFETGIKSLMTRDNTMAKEVFKNCGNKEEVTLKVPSSIEYFGESLFENTYVKDMDFGNTSLKGIGKNCFKTNYKKKTNNFSLPNTLFEINDYAFNNNEINVLNIPKSVNLIGQYAFEDSNINNISFNDSDSLIIDKYAFLNNNIKVLNIKDGTKTIGDYAFKDNALESLYIPNSVEKIGKGSFLSNKLGKKENQINSFNKDYNWCLILFDKSGCTSTLENGVKKVNLGSDTRIINIKSNEIDNSNDDNPSLGGATLDE